MARKKIHSRKRSSKRPSKRPSKKRYHKRRQQKGGKVVDVMEGVVTEDKYLQKESTQPKTMNVVPQMSSDSLDTLKDNLKKLRETRKAKRQYFEEKIREIDSQIDELRGRREKANKEKSDYEKKYFDEEDILIDRIKSLKMTKPMQKEIKNDLIF